LSIYLLNTCSDLIFSDELVCAVEIFVFPSPSID